MQHRLERPRRHIRSLRAVLGHRVARSASRNRTLVCVYMSLEGAVLELWLVRMNGKKRNTEKSKRRKNPGVLLVLSSRLLLYLFPCYLFMYLFKFLGSCKSTERTERSSCTACSKPSRIHISSGSHALTPGREPGTLFSRGMKRGLEVE